MKKALDTRFRTRAPYSACTLRHKRLTLRRIVNVHRSQAHVLLRNEISVAPPLKISRYWSEPPGRVLLPCSLDYFSLGRRSNSAKACGQPKVSQMNEHCELPLILFRLRTKDFRQYADSVFGRPHGPKGHDRFVSGGVELHRSSPTKPPAPGQAMVGFGVFEFEGLSFLIAAMD